MYMIIFIGLIICMLACHFMAKRKGYNPVAWGVTGAVLGPIALIVILLLPARN
ncbi:MAG: hypothetical protein OEY52_02030 [Gammaproteobacteria bacterium]|nr:hypothetical protein [Gammaproteobacteria bacterium]